MSADRFAAQLEAIIVEARDAGVSDEEIIKLLEDAIDALDEGQS